uniref:Putative tick kunitz 95 n=1 Tax=Amblyomma cajennense TaxID=34607 RepID=A0A023FU58_AMBCJ
MLLYTVLGICLIALAHGAKAQKNDPRCRYNRPVISTPGCLTSRFQFDSASRVCVPTCNKDAPFNAQRECDIHCRSKVICTPPRPTTSCEAGSLVTVFYYHPQIGRCLKDTTACSYLGNNFPYKTECEKTCSGLSAVAHFAGRAGGRCSERPTQGYYCPQGRPSYRFFYQQNTNRCYRFPFFGCGAGRNNFLSYASCHRQCVRG